MSKIFLVSIIFIAAVTIAAFGLFMSQLQAPSPSPTILQQKTAQPSPVSVDIKASFAIFTNGTFRIFTDSKYHNLSKDVYLESSNPNIIHVKKSGITYDDFFKTLPMKLTKECLVTGTGQQFCTGEDGQLKFYLNGQRDDLLEKEIRGGDNVLISFGDESEIQINQQLEVLNSY